jgi:iron complex outermembrane receptor protein
LNIIPIALALLALHTASASAASSAEEDERSAALAEQNLIRVMPPVQTSASRLQAIDAFRIPASISRVELSAETERVPLQIAAALASVPGVQARERQNLAQDTQLSMRGFGARSTFGVRGVRLYADGIPATLPDGQGQLAHFNLLGAQSLEILRGPFSALYGNSAGGVLLLHSAGGSAAPSARLASSYGAYDTYSLGTQLRGGNASGAFGYNVAVQRFDTEGYRRHSAAGRESANIKLQWRANDVHRMELVVNHYRAPEALDPLGLDAAQLRSDRRQAPLAEQFNTRKRTAQDQLGLLWHSQLNDAHSLRIQTYAGQRAVEQFLSLPIAAQANPLNSGGLIDLDATYAGTDLRWSFEGTLAGRELQWSAGLNIEQLRQQRLGFENFVGSTLGRRGALRRDELGQVRSNDQYAQAWWQLSSKLALLAGARHSSVQFRSDDYYIRGGNPDDSGRINYAQTTPVLGLSYAVGDDFNLHLAIGRGFETPTFNELSYRVDGGAGLALDLRPAVSTNVELGGKWRNNDGLSAELSVFRIDTDDEIAVARNIAGRSSFRNVGRSRRHGAELAARVPLTPMWTAQLAYTHTNAAFRDPFGVCGSSGCSNPSVQVAAGTRIPGVVRDQLFGQLQWQSGDWSGALETVAIGAVSVNDTGSARAAGYALLNAEIARAWPLHSGLLRAYLRIDNLLDHRYIGSVIVNEGNARYFEPGPERALLLGLQWNFDAAPR